MMLNGSEDEGFLNEFKTNRKTGLSTDEASHRREEDGYNVVDPPIKCPAWVCCLLPCIKSIPSMKTFRMIKPDDAEILRNGHWVKYDATSLVRGDIVRMEAGDTIPADCIILEVEDGPMLVDSRYITGEVKPQSLELNPSVDSIQLFMGSHVVQGSGISVVTAIGANTKLASIIREKKFPPNIRSTERIGDPEACVCDKD